jgi:hypothetical protein
MTIQSSTVVSIRYKMKNQKGEVLGDDAYRTAQYVHGAGSIVPYLEKPLEGSGPGERKSFNIRLNNKEYLFDVFIDEVRMATENEINSGLPEKACCSDGEC